MTNLMPDDREAAMRVIDDDENFDRWWSNYLSKTKGSGTNKGSTSPARQASNDEFNRKYSREIGSE